MHYGQKGVIKEIKPETWSLPHNTLPATASLMHLPVCDGGWGGNSMDTVVEILPPCPMAWVRSGCGKVKWAENTDVAYDEDVGFHHHYIHYHHNHLHYLRYHRPHLSLSSIEFQWILLIFTKFSKLLTDRQLDGWTDGRMDGQTDGQTQPLTELRGRIQKRRKWRIWIQNFMHY